MRDAEVTAIARARQRLPPDRRNAGETLTLETPLLVNSAGLWAPRIAGLIEGLDRRFVPPTFLAKGNYATLMVKSPFRHLVYPVPEPGGLGVHLTLDMGGAARFGPNVEWLASMIPPRSTMPCRPPCRPNSRPRIAAYWPEVTRSRCWRPAIPACVRKPAARKIPTPISASRDPKRMALPAWSICSGSKAPASPLRWRSPNEVKGMLRDA